jgi:hypothetical protein
VSSRPRPLRPIRLIDHSTGPHHELQYAAPDDWWRWIFGRYPVAGTVHGRVCARCGRIVVFGERLGKPGNEPPRLPQLSESRAPARA